MTRFLPSLARRCALFVVATLFASAATAGPSLHLFSAKLTLNETVGFTFAPPCIAIASVQATGVALNLGKFTATAQDCINPLGTFVLGGVNSFAFSSTASPAGLVLLFDSGEQLFITYSGTLTPRLSAPHRLAGQFVITGGTGRFFGATGGGVLSGQEDISQVVFGQGTADAIGTILY
jgi:hypothetical protein